MKYVEDVSIAGRKAEIEIKLKRVREMLDKEGLKGLLLKKHSNFSWITAGGKSIVTLCMDAGEVAILVTQNGQYAITSIIEQGRMRDEEKLGELGFEIHYHDWYKNESIKIITELAGCSMSEIGSDMSLGDTKVINEKINPLRYSLTENEIARYQYLGGTLSAALEEYIVIVKPGMTEYEITGGLCNALWKYDIDPVLFLVSADERAYRYRHGIPTGNVLKEHLIISVNGRYKGLITTTTRMVHFGKKDDQLVRQFDDTCEIEARSIASIRIDTDDISGYYACKKAYEDLGYANMWPLHGQGGSQGYNNRDYMLTESSHGITQVNQCYCFNPVIDGTKAEDAFIATTDGPLFVTKPVTFPVVYKMINGKQYALPGIQFID